MEGHRPVSKELAWRQRWVGGAPSHAPIPPPPHPTFNLCEVVRVALDEDAGGLGDVTTNATVGPETQAHAVFLAKDDGVLAGLAVADQVFETVDPTVSVEWSARDGDHVAKGTRFGVVTGSARAILVAERIALNFMQRMSGIATATAKMVAAVEDHPARILETRKTVPGLRLLDKWGVLIGRGVNHRMGLFDMVMIKDNHITAAGGIPAAVSAAQKYVHARGMKIPIEVETRTLEEVQEVLNLLAKDPTSLVSRLMLDNMTKLDPACAGGVDVSMLREAVTLVNGRIDTEASGNVTQDTVREIASTGVTFISVGALTHSVKALDISLKIETK